MYALNETLDAQTHMVHSHSEGISDLKETSGKLWNKIDEDISSHNERLTHLEDALTGKNADSNEKFDQLQCLINHHGESVSQLSNQVQQLTGEFRGVLQTVDDQVCAKCYVFIFYLYILKKIRSRYVNICLMKSPI